MARMRRPPRPRRRRRTGLLMAPLALVVLALGAWYVWPRPKAPTAQPTERAADVEPAPIAIAPRRDSTAAAQPRPAVRPASQARDQAQPAARTMSTAEPPASETTDSIASKLRLGQPPGAPTTQPAALPRPESAADETANITRVRLAADATADPVALRSELNRALARTRDEAKARRLRQQLAKLADRTIFSREIFENDPLVEAYTVQSGETLIAIAKRYKVSPEIIMRINGIRDARRLRAGQRIKVPHGPFHIRIDKSDFRLDLYLQDLFVRSFTVGLGTNGGTPLGTWKVKNRLRNPTYFPPASAADKRVIPADDPTNPLGEFWIGLEGIAGEALGQEGYGIHGTIDPDSIGKNVSLGCVRMHNRDVEFVFGCVRPGESTVTIVP